MAKIREYLEKQGYDFSKPTKKQQFLAKQNYGNLDKEIVSLNDTLTDLFTSGKWRDAPTMKGYSDSLSSTLEKVKGYKDYITKYHANDKGAAKLLEFLSDTENYYTGATDNLKYLTGYYGGFTNAKSFADQKAKDDAKAAELLKLQDLAKNADFADRSGYIRSADLLKDRSSGASLYMAMNGDAGWYLGGYDPTKGNSLSSRDVSSLVGVKDTMTDEEKALYYYIANTQGYQSGQDYLLLMQDTLNHRKGKEIANSWAGRNLPVLTSLVSGVDSASEGLINAANSLINPNKERPTSAMQYAGGLIGQREAEEGVVQGIAAQISQSIGQMTPQILVSLATGNVGGAAKGVASAASKMLSLATLGASVYGNAYNEALQRGQDGWRAYGYGLGNAAVEIAAESFADGINLISSGSWGKALATKLTGNKFKAVTEIVAEIADKPRIKYLLDALGEGAEEVFSAALEPALESFFLKETFDPASVEEMLYSGLLGALTSGVMNAPGVPGQVANYKYYSGMNQTLNDADIDTIRAEAMQMGEKSKSYNAAKEFEGVETKDLANRHRRRILEAFNTENREKTNEIVGNAVARNYAESEKTNDNVDKAAEKAAEMKGKYNTATDGKAYTKDGTEADFSDFTETVEIDEEGNAVFTAKDGRTLSTADDVVPEIVAEGVALLANLPSIPKSAYSTYFQYLPKQTNTKAYTRAFATLFEMGKNAEGMKLATSAAFADAELDELSQGAIYLQGVNTRKSADEASKDAFAKARSAAEKNGKFNAKKGKLNDKAVRNMKLTRAQKNAITMLSSFTEFGINVEIYASTEANRKNTPNGWFDSTTGTIHLDINAGENADVVGSGVFWTIAHESTHMIKVTAPEAYKVLQEYVLDEMFETEDALDEAIGKEMMRHDLQHPNEPKMSRADAIEEIVARSCESIFKDSEQLAKMLAEGEAKEQGFAEKVVNAIKDILEKIVTFFKSLSAEYNPESEEGKFFSENEERTLKLKEIYDNAFAEAVEGAKVVYGTENAFEDIGVELDNDSESASPMFSERTWSESEYVTNRDEAARNLAKALDVPVEKAKRYIDNVNSIAKAISNDRARLDYQASSFGSAFVSNVEYGGSFDFTTLCKKRRIYTGTFSEIQKRIGEAVLTPEDILEIRNLMLEGGFEATCGLCYVEGSRANMGKFAKKFIELYKRDNPDAWIPKMVDVNTPDGVEQMRINHPEVYEKYEYFWNHYGKLKDSDPALFASQQKPKLYEARKEYKGEILQHFDDVEAIAEKNRKGGIRMQSFSDFEIVHLIDTMQIIMDMAKVGLAGQAYTKVPEFADAFGNTGLKINLSLIAKGVDENGKLIFDDREGMPAETAFKLRNKYSSNVGTIIVAFTDDQVKAAMADPRIDFIIPFHRSQWKKSQYGAMGLPKGTKDYTYVQNEKLIKPTYHEYRGRMVKDKATNFMPNKYWDFSKSGKENAENYLKMCAENNKRPKFYKFLDYDGKGTYSLKEDGSTDGYWKLLIDFKMYDNNGVGSPQRAVTPDFSMDEAMTMLDEYKGGHQKYPIAHGVVDKFVDTYESRHKSAVMYSDRAKAEIAEEEVPQAETDVEARIMRSDRSTQRDAEYLDAVKRGDMETAQRMVDEAAYTKNYVVAGYHGTPNGGFTKFGGHKTRNGAKAAGSYWFAEEIDHAKVYKSYPQNFPAAENPMVYNVYLDIGNWADIGNGRVEALDYSFDGEGAATKELRAVAKAIASKTQYKHSGKSETARVRSITQQLTEIGRNIYADFIWQITETQEFADLCKKEGLDSVVAWEEHKKYNSNGERETHMVKTYGVFSPEQIKSADPITYDDNGNVIPLSERFKSENADIRYSDRRPNRDREILAQVIGDSKLQQKFYYYKKEELKKYDNALESYNKALAEVNRIENEIRQLPRGNTQNSRVKKLKKSLEFYYGRLQTAEEKMFTYEAEGLRDVIDAEIRRLNEVARKTGIESRREAIRERVERASRAAQIASINNSVKDTMKMLNADTKHKYVPDALKQPVINILTALDFTKSLKNGTVTKSSQALDDAVQGLSEIDVSDLKVQLAELKTAIKDNVTPGGDGFAFDLNEDTVEVLEDAVNKLAEIKEQLNNMPEKNIYSMDSESLEAVKIALKVLNTVIRNADKAFASGMDISDAARGTISEVSARPEANKGKAATFFRSNLYFKLVDPIRQFAKMGPEALKMFKALMEADSRRAFLVERVREFIQKEIGSENLKKWDKQTITFDNIPVINSEGDIEVDKNGNEKTQSITVTATQIMALHCHWQRNQSKKHLANMNEDGEPIKTGGGVFRKKLDSGEYEESARVRFDDALVSRMVSELSKEQIEAADKMQSYMSNELAELGNMVSYKRWGINAFTEKYYIPIVTKKGVHAKEDDSGRAGNLLKIINKSWTKRVLKNAKGPMYIDSLTEAFTGHAIEMIDYNTFALPILDIVRWLNFENTANGADESVSQSIEKAFGKDGIKFVKTLIEDINGSSSKPTAGIGMQKFFLRNTKLALVGGKIKQVFLQPTSVVRATEVISYSSLRKGVGTVLKVGDPENNVKGKIELARKWSGTALWKSMGYIDTNFGAKTFAERILEEDAPGNIKGRMTHDIKNVLKGIKGKDGKKAYDALVDASLIWMEKGDEIGWAVLWAACESDVLATQKSLVPKSDEFYKAVARLFDEVVYKTQVTDSVLAKSASLRSTNTLETMTASFMGEPIKSINGVIDVTEKIVADSKRIGKKAAFLKHKNELFKEVSVFATQAFTVALVSAIADHIGDDEEDLLDYKLFIKKFGNNIFEEINPLMKIPYIADIANIVIYGYDSSRLDLEAFSEVQQAFTAVINGIQGDGKYTSWGVIMQILEAASLISGVSAQNMLKDAKDAWNATIGEVFEEAEWREKKK